ncbi:proline iminopeptidase-family hydrolase [Sphingomonas humi]|uniref:Proline iminopeptidase-family hydrolase n=1 Tax=Sphingomonas humi TaxID=335630 RepID=A0ABP7RTU3_9SPHN
MPDIQRRTFLQGSLAAGACAIAAPLRARGPASFPPPDLERMVAVPGGRVYVRANGALKGGKPPLVMIHGGPGSTHGGFLPALALADERAIILYDQLGSGRSDPITPADWKVPRFVAELEPIRRALGVERWHVLGGSWGGTIALEYGALRPPALASLILASPLVSTRRWLADANALRSKLPADVRQALDRCDPPASASAACATASEQYNSRYLAREPRMSAVIAYAEAQQKAGGRGFNNALYQGMWGSTEFIATGTLRDYDGEPLLAKLDGRHTLFMVGQYDEARPVTAADFAERVPGAELAVVPGAGHAIPSDRPDEYNAILRNWLRRQDQA